MTSKHPLTLFEPEELARLAERSRLDVQGGVRGEVIEDGESWSDKEEQEVIEREHARLVRGLAGLRLAARCYALSRDPAGLRPIVWGAWALRAGHGLETHVDSEARIATAVLSVGPRLLEVPGLAEALASSPLAAVRCALAEALPEGSASESILRALADDDEAEVRAAARRKIQDDDPWGGAFPISPDGHPDEVLEAARRELERPSYQREVEDVVSAFAPLQDPLAVACWVRLLACFGGGRAFLREGVLRLLERRGGGEGFVHLMVKWERRSRAFFGKSKVRAARERLSEARRVEAFAEMIRALGELEREESPRSGDAPGGHLRDFIVRAAVALEPSHGDARALLEAILGSSIERAREEASAGGFDHAAHMLSGVLARWPLEGELRQTLLAMRRAGKPGRWAQVGGAVWNRLGPDPVLRERAWRELEEGDARARSEAVRALLGPQHDPAEDGSVEEVAARLYERPELRASLLRWHRPLLERGRDDLDAGRLDLQAAVAVMERIPDAERTDAMWAEVRALRDRWLADGGDGSWLDPAALEALVHPGDEWEPSDLAFVRAIVERALTASEKPRLLPFVIDLIDAKESEESAALLREIDERATTDELREAVRRGRQLSDSRRALER